MPEGAAGHPAAPSVSDRSGQGRVHFWLAAPEMHVHRCTTVPSAELLPDTSRHLPDCGLRSVPSDCATQFWFAPPLHVHNCTFVPSADPPPLTSRHLPSAVNV